MKHGSQFQMSQLLSVFRITYSRVTILDFVLIIAIHYDNCAKIKQDNGQQMYVLWWCTVSKWDVSKNVACDNVL